MFVKQTLNVNNLKILFVLALVVFLAYGNALFNGFVYDDGYLIVKNKYIKDFAYLKEVFLSDVTKTSPYERASGYYRPVSMTFLMAGYHLWGLNTFFWHLASIFLHLANVWLVFFLLARLVKSIIPAFIAALIFAVHPIHVEAVAPIYNFMGLLATFFSLGAWVAFIKAEEKKLFLGLSVILLFLGLFSKEEVLVLPAVFIVYDYYFVARFKGKELFKRWWIYLGLAAAEIFYLWMRSLVIERPAAFGLWDLNLTFNVAPAANAFWHMLTIVKVYFLYLLSLITPGDLSAFYMVPAASAGDWTTWLGLAVILGLLIYAVLAMRRNSLLSFFILLFFVSVLPVSNLIPIGGLFAERLIYFPSLAYCAVVGILLVSLQLTFAERIELLLRGTTAPNLGQEIVVGAPGNLLVPGAQNWNIPRIRVHYLLVVALVIVWGFKTVERNYVWRNNLTLWRDTVVQSPSSLIVRLNLAEAYAEAGLLDEAIVEYRNALTTPSLKSFQIHNALGKIYGRRAQYDLAIDEFIKVIALNSAFSEGYYNTGISYFNKGDLPAAESYFLKGIPVNPDYAWNYYGLGLVAQMRGDLSKARDLFLTAHRKDPQHAGTIEALQRIQR